MTKHPSCSMKLAALALASMCLIAMADAAPVVCWSTAPASSAILTGKSKNLPPTTYEYEM